MKALAKDVGHLDLPRFANCRSGNFSFVVSGSSRPELDGEYVQQDRFYGHRPVFYCAENERMLFYQKENGAWQILGLEMTRTS